MADAQLKHWRLETDSGGIGWLILDKADADSNTLSADVLAELDAILARPELAQLDGLAVKSAKSTGFILGADVKEFSALRDAEQAAAAAARGQAVMARLEALAVPTVAVIDGYALGGGLELALACDYRVAAGGYERTLGLPEVQLGIHPGFGASVRAVRLMGPFRALDGMLTGRSMSPREALGAGLVDRLAAAGELDEAARELIRRSPPRRTAPWYLRLANVRPFRVLIAWLLRRRVARRVRAEHYPAPFAIIDLWRRFGGGAAAYRAEAESIGRLLVSRTSKNLVRVFLLRERLRHLAPKDSDIERVHVVGAGVMGGDIAAWCALRGLDVSLQDREQRFIDPAIERAKRLFGRRLRAPGAADEAAARLRSDIDGHGLAGADLVIEAIIEDLDAKRSLLKTVEPRLKAGALIATNTSSIRLEDLAPALAEPGRFVGLHFFNPVARLPLVEVIEGAASSPAALQRAMSFVTRIDKLPLPCKSAPGFVVNRILTPYMLEALYAHDDGHALETIDAAATAFGMPVGPIELADRVGLDVALKVAETLAPVLRTETPALLASKVAAGELGVKTGRGFYRYDGGRARKRKRFPRPDAELQDRLVLPLINEAMACCRDGVVAEPDLLDAGAVFGAGFAPFTGGPMHYARERGVDALIARLEHLAGRHGARFEPDPGWRQAAAGA